MRTCAPPDPDTRKPLYTPPDGACDAHCHVFGPAARFPYHPDRRYTPPDAPFEALRRLHGRLGFARAVLVQATCHGTDNRAMIDALERSGGAYRGVAMVEPGLTGDDVARLHAAGIRGVRFSHARHIGGAPRFDRVAATAELIAPVGWHIELYLEPGDLVAHAGAIRELPVPVVIDHMARVNPADGLGQPAYRLLLDLAADAGAWIKVSCLERLSRQGYPYEDVLPFAREAVGAAPGRVLWGTDWPHPNIAGTMPNDGDLVDLIPRIAPDEGVRRKLLVDNAARLYGFDA